MCHMTATTLDTREAHLIDAAAHAEDVIVLHRTSDPITLAQVDGDVIKDVQVLKTGTFNGVVEVTAEDLDLFAARFHELSSTGTFVPPQRIDHSWDVLSVVGWYEDLRVEEHPDPTNGDAATLYLVGDFRLVGTAAEKAEVRERIKSGKLRNRSSEIMAYRTNTGREYARIFAGCAFVDIPAVEGLAPIVLRRDTATLSQDSTDKGRGSAVADSTEQDQTTEPEGDGVVVTPADGKGAEVEGSSPSAESPDEPGEGGEGIVIGEPAPEPEATGGTDEEPTPREPAELRAVTGLDAALRAAGLNVDPDKLATIRTAFDREVLRQRTADDRLSRFRDKGVIPLSVADRVEALLRHDDDTVRDSVAALLELASPPVTIDEHAGDRASERPDDDGKTTPAELRGLSGDELGDAWAGLTHAQRKAPEYQEAYRLATGTRPALDA